MHSQSNGRAGRSRWPRLLGGACFSAFYLAYVVGGLALGLGYASAAVSHSGEAGGLGLALSSGGATLPFSPIINASNPIMESSLFLVPDWKGTDRINVLLLGVDQRAEERAAGIPTRSDTMIVVSIDPVQKTAAMISFPRDLWVTIPGFGEERINVAYVLGELRKVEGGGPGLAARTLDANFGLRPSYYAIVDFGGFQEVVNTLGGVVVDVPRPLRDDQYPTDDYNIERIYFAPGPQIMDGATALKYVRTRHSDSDIGRMTRQQQVLFAIRDRGMRTNMLPRLPTLIDQASRTVQTNFTPGEMLSLAKLATQMDTGALGTLVVDYQLVSQFRGVAGASLLMPKKDEIRRAIQKAMADPRLVREAGKVEVASTASDARLGQQTADRLSGEGLQVVRRTTNLPSAPETTRVIVSTEKPRSLQATLQGLGLTEAAVETSDTALDVDIRVILGHDFQLPSR